MRINLNISIEKPRWLNRLFRCKHNVVLVEENYDSRYGCHASYIYCLKCGRKASDISKNCKHELDGFGKCRWCRDRIIYPCNEEHDFVNEPDTDDRFCEKCGEWEDRS